MGGYRWTIAVLFVAVFCWASTCYAADFVIGGTVQFKNGKAAKDVEVWLKSDRGNVSTSRDITDSEGKFAFDLPPPKADAYKLFVYPYGIMYDNLAAKDQKLSIDLPVNEAASASGWAKSRTIAERLKLLRAIREFRKGVTQDDDASKKIREGTKAIESILEDE